MNEDNILGEDINQPMQTVDLSAVTPPEHSFDHIVGNQLLCSRHNDACTAVYVRPTQVLVKGDDGQFQLIDMAPR
jgi:hypothetical protein